MDGLHGHSARDPMGQQLNGDYGQGGNKSQECPYAQFRQIRTVVGRREHSYQGNQRSERAASRMFEVCLEGAFPAPLAMNE